MRNTETQARQLALGGVLASLAVVILILGGLVPVGTYVAPMLASLPLIALLAELPMSLCFGWFAVVATLSVLLCPDRETACVFVFLGWYPIVRPALDRLPKLPRLSSKLLIFNAAVAALYGLLLLVFRLEALIAEARETGAVLFAALLLLGNLTFLLFDVLLERLTVIYQRKRKK